MKTVLTSLTFMAMVGCTTTVPVTKYDTVEVKVPFYLPCDVQTPEKLKLNVDQLRPDDDMYEKTKALIADHYLMKGHITELDSVIEACKLKATKPADLKAK